MTVSSDAAQLLRRHLPVLRYDSQGSFMADSPAILTDRVSAAGRANQLKRADGTVLATAAGGAGRPRLELTLLGWPRYSEGTPAARSDYLDAVGRDYVLQAREMHRGDLADRVYGHARPAVDGGWWLQYWFFYLYNDKAFLGIGLHEGDWEMVQVRIAPDGSPSAMAFAQHNHGQRCGWGLVQKRGHPRPIVYVARGSQASFASAGRHDAPVVPDHADGKGPEVAHATLDLVDDEATDWLAWPGRWGSTKARNRLESNSPRGPAHQDKWNEPEAFHEECDEIRRERAREAPPPGPAAPEITVRREADRALIGYRFTEVVPGHSPEQLLVTLDSLGDALPPATQTFPVESQSGEVEHPLPLEDGRYRVLVSAADAQGNVSDPATALLD
jgi:hypothetical protein